MADATIALTLGVILVGLVTMLIHIGVAGDVGNVWGFLYTTLAFLVLVGLVSLIALSIVRLSSPTRSIKRP